VSLKQGFDLSAQDFVLGTGLGEEGIPLVWFKLEAVLQQLLDPMPVFVSPFGRWLEFGITRHLLAPCFRLP
jgi:hypothetical protein